MASGTFKVGDRVTAYPAGIETTITGIHTYEGPQAESIPQLSYSITVGDEIDISRGGMLAKIGEAPCTTQEFDAMICWFSDKKHLKPKGRFHLRHTTSDVRAVVTDVLYKINISTLEKTQESEEFALNDIGCIRIRCAAPIFYDPYTKNRTTGSFVLVDEQTNNTVAAGMIIRPLSGEPSEDAAFSI
ncbi:MAG: sulfate adenylyltransferase, partial [Prosthecobacter sp.]|nr:sulfate adenylyltransferase [Prosthecobacter sp.]